jgi:matrix metalloproteinase-16 (membrane-inserted)
MVAGSVSKWAPNPHKPDGSDGHRRTTTSPKVTPRREKTNYPSDGRPSTCDSSYDAISLIRNELFIFKGRYFWRVNSTPNDNRLLKGYPSLITSMWQRLPADLTHVDAVYEHNEVDIVFFIGTNISPGIEFFK